MRSDLQLRLTFGLIVRNRIRVVIKVKIAVGVRVRVRISVSSIVRVYGLGFRGIRGMAMAWSELG